MNMMNEDIEFLLHRLYMATEIPIQVYDREGNRTSQIGLKDHNQDSFFFDDILMNGYISKAASSKFPLFEIEEGIFLYGLLTDDKHRSCILGPVILKFPTQFQLHEYHKRHGIVNKEFTMHKKSLMDMANALSTAYFIIAHEKMDEKMILSKNQENLKVFTVEEQEVNEYQFLKAEHDSQHFSYHYEQQYLNAVENGDVLFFENMLLEEPKVLEKVGILANDSIKQLEYMCVSSIVLVSRAAIRGGINPSTAYALSELYMQKTERCRNSQELLNLHLAMELDFTRKVREQKEKKRNEDYIEQCKDYISERVHYPIRVKEVADVIGINHSYLSKKFKEREGITIIQYCIQVKLQAAANMLKYSEADIATIADYLCFASQSRFGEQFREFYGVTPRVYRKENRVIEFTSIGNA